MAENFFDNGVLNQECIEFNNDNRTVWEKSKIQRMGHCIANKKNIHPTYIKYFYKLRLNEILLDSIFDVFAELKTINWNISFVPGYIPSDSYARLIANGYFPISTLFRKKNQIDYSPVPDFIHDVFGHIPMLFDTEYSSYLKNIANAIIQAPSNELDQQHYEAELKLALLYYNNVDENSQQVIQSKKHLDSLNKQLIANPSLKTLLSRMFLWSIEFGIIGTVNDFIIFGAGILSSTEELNRILKKNILFENYNMDVVFKNFDYFTDVQKFLFISPSLEYYNIVLQQFKERFNTFDCNNESIDIQ